MRSFVAVAAFAIAAAVTVPRYMAQKPGGLFASSNLAPSILAAPTDAQANPANTRSIVVAPDSHGHFRVEGRVDTQRMDFVVDTGATEIALTARDAETLGIHPAPSDYKMLVQTANGTVRAAQINLSTVQVGSITVRDVAAIVLPEAALSENLLGTSFLSRLQRYEYSNGRLVLQQ
jgi:aspartyl protease family protein